jgi:hypothetical protein
MRCLVCVLDFGLAPAVTMLELQRQGVPLLGALNQLPSSVAGAPGSDMADAIPCYACVAASFTFGADFAALSLLCWAEGMCLHRLGEISPGLAFLCVSCR